MPFSLRSTAVVLCASALVAAGCGGDDDESDTSAAPAPAPAETTAAPPADPSVEITEERIREIVSAVNENPETLCDPDNITAALLEQIGGEEACLEAAGAQEPGDFEIEEIAIEGQTATAIITEGDSTTAVTFTVEGDQIKVAAQGAAQPEPSGDGESGGE